MSPDAQRLLDQARQLPPEEREWLAECLLIRDEEGSAAEIDAAWKAEVERRVAEDDQGAGKTCSWEDIEASLRTRQTK